MWWAIWSPSRDVLSLYCIILGGQDPQQRRQQPPIIYLCAVTLLQHNSPCNAVLSAIALGRQRKTFPLALFGLGAGGGNVDTMVPDAAGVALRVWTIDTGLGPDPSDFAVLSKADYQRGARYKRTSDRNAFLQTRASLRRALSPIIGIDPSSIRFEENPWGKPTVIGCSCPVDFSVSHTAERSVVAMTRGSCVGIDIECDRLVADRDRIALTTFGAAIAHRLLGLHAAIQNATFLRLWTAAEAFVKATGRGFAGTAAPIPLALTDDYGTVRLRDTNIRPGVRAQLRTLPLPDGFCGSIVFEDISGIELGMNPRETLGRN